MTTSNNDPIQKRVDLQNYRYLLQCALEQTTIRTLTLTEPWSSLVASGAKKLETRTWSPHHTGLIAIHSSQQFCWDDEFYCYNPHFEQALAQAGYQSDRSRRKRKERWSFPYGKVIAIAWLSDSYQLDPLVFTGDLPPEPERSFGNYAPGRYVWLLPYVYRLVTPIPARGWQMLWNWTPPESFKDEIQKALAAHDAATSLSASPQGDSR
jgi:activating signal cointegrator 1